MRDERKQNLKVGLLILAALLVIGLTILMVGKRQQLFARHTYYLTSFENVTGLDKGSPVKLDGVTVGYIRSIDLSVKPDQRDISIKFAVDSRFMERIREDSRVSIRSMGLLGDRYLNVSGGSVSKSRILEGGLIRSQAPAELAHFVSSGEDLMENLIAISSSLRAVLERVEAGEGLLGELTTSPETGAKLGDTLSEAINTLADIFARIDRGEGLLGRLVREDSDSGAIIDELVATSRSLHRITTRMAMDLENPDSVYAALLRDQKGGKKLEETLNSLQTASSAIAAVAEELATGEGTLPRLLQDREFAGDFLDDLKALVHSLRSASEKLDRGEGTAGAFINDKQLYQDLEDVVRGVKDSKVVSWFIRSKREKGEKHRLEEENQDAEKGKKSGAS